MLEIADERVPLQVEARCWCGARATHNARVVNDLVVYEGETVMVGDTLEPGAMKIFGDVVRYELPQLGAFNFVLAGALGGGVTRSLALDAHGKSLSSALLELEIPGPGDERAPAR